MKMPPKALKMAVERVMETFPSADMAEIQNAVELGYKYEMEYMHDGTLTYEHVTYVMNRVMGHDWLVQAQETGVEKAKELKATKLWRYLDGGE